MSGRPLLIRAARVHTLRDAAAALLAKPGARAFPGAPAIAASVPTAPAADAVLLDGGRIAAVGSFGELRERSPSAEVVDLPGATLTPALTDAHVHLIDWALSLRWADLAGARSPAEATDRLAAHAAAGGRTSDWILGRGWNPHRWTEEPSARPLDDRFPGRAVALQSHDMHALWVSSEALRRADVHAGTPDPAGGRIVRDDAGVPTGVLLENAVALVTARIPKPDEAERRAAAIAGQAALHRLGIAGVHSVEPDSLRVYQALESDGVLRLRVLQHLPLALLDEAVALGLRSGFGGEWIRVGGVKMFLDGALGSRTAWLRSPYEGSDGRGVPTLEAGVFRDAVARGARAGLAATVHAIGDAAVDLALDVLGDVAHRGAALPHRIEHLQLVAPDRVGAAAAAGVVASMQPCHLLTDWRPAERHWGGERSRGAYAFASLLRAGTVLAFGSDIPVEPPDPRLGLRAAVARADAGGQPPGGWNPGERISPSEALAAYTVGPAWAAGTLGAQGVIAPGAFADVVAWSADPLEAPADAIPDLEVRATFVDGRVVHPA